MDYPLVCVGARSTHGKVASTSPRTTSRQARLAAQYLFDHGATNCESAREPIGSISSSCATPWKATRSCACEAYSKRVPTKASNWTQRPVPNVGQDWTIGSGARMTQRIVDSGIPFDGIVAFNDQLALGALFTLAANGIAVPDRVQVIGFDNNEEAAYFQPPLTTMDSCLDWIVPTAVSRIINRIDGSRTLEPELITTQSRIIARATTRA